MKIEDDIRANAAKRCETNTVVGQLGECAYCSAGQGEACRVQYATIRLGPPVRRRGPNLKTPRP